MNMYVGNEDVMLKKSNQYEDHNQLNMGVNELKINLIC